jgi:glutamate N-acetyltransferase/amino-acid N-acetyltransferase
VNDFCLIRSATPCSAAGVFTLNQFCAAPVVVSKALLARTAGEGVHGVAINAGCANACTGERGLRDAEEMVNLAKEAGVDNALVMSTGVIGPFLPMDKIKAGQS